MDQIQHKHVPAKGLNLHVAEIGSGDKVVLLVHGFPEIWYSWRHQMVALAEAGYRAIAFDCRGYGLSDHPSEPEKATMTDFADDVVTLLDSLNIPKAFLVGKDSGAIVMSLVAALYPERLSAFITLGIPFMLPGLGSLEENKLPKGFYISRWKEPGRAEADFGRFDVKTVIRNIYLMFTWSELQVANEDQEIMDLVAPNTPLPSWFSEDDLSVYADLYQKSGFRTALQVPYRTFENKVEVKAETVTVPSLLIMGEEDYVIKFPGMEDYIRSGMVKQFVPNLDVVFMPEGNHFVQEQLPDEVNKLIISFLNKQTTIQ